jgi:hypothetical protein
MLIAVVHIGRTTSVGRQPLASRRGTSPRLQAVSAKWQAVARGLGRDSSASPAGQANDRARSKRAKLSGLMTPGNIGRSAGAQQGFSLLQGRHARNETPGSCLLRQGGPEHLICQPGRSGFCRKNPVLRQPWAREQVKIGVCDSCHWLMIVITMFHFFHDMQSVSVKIEGSSSGLCA